MSYTIRIALRRIKNKWVQNLFFILMLVFSTMVTSAFAAFALQTFSHDSKYDYSLFQMMMPDLQMYLITALSFLILITFITFKSCCVLQKNDDEHLLAVLTSVGAVSSQIRRFVYAEIIVMYIPAILISALAGVSLGDSFGRSFTGSSTYRSAVDILLSIALLIAVATLEIVLVVICNRTPKPTKKSLLDALRNRNNGAATSYHGYHNSQTWNSGDIIKRLSRKSLEYYRPTYNAIALTISASALYPVIAVLLICMIGNSRYELDACILSSSEFNSTIDRLVVFMAVMFLLLTITGAFQSFTVTRVQYFTRKQSESAYLSAGISGKDFKKLITSEIVNVLVRSLVLWMFGTTAIITVFSML